jgi:hypothetical protein
LTGSTVAMTAGGIMRLITSALAATTLFALAACGSDASSPAGSTDSSPLDDASSADTATTDDATVPDTTPPGDSAAVDSVAPVDSGSPADSGAPKDSGSTDGGTPDAAPTTGPTLAGCPLLPANHIFNTAIDKLPVHPNSAAFMATIGSPKIHLDLGQSVNMAAPDTYYGIPYNVVHAASLTWTSAKYSSLDTVNLNWDPRPESDCANGAGHTLVSPCVASTAPSPVFPIPSGVLVEGGIFPDVASQAYGDHHIIMLDADSCRLWELYHAYTGASGTWDIFGSASWDLHSNALRPADWTSADAAGFPILPLLLRAAEASSGTIHHALRFTIQSSSIRAAYTWPARHLTNNGGTSANKPPMGQLFRLKASYAIPATYGTQSKAILTALKTYGMYIADGGSNLYVQGEPSASWSDAVFTEVQSVGAGQFEAVDLSPIQARAGFSVNSGAVPP